MEALFASASAPASQLLLSQMATDGVAALLALGRIAAHHQGRSDAELRTGFVAVNEQHFPPPDQIQSLMGQLLASVGRILSECKSPLDDLHAAAFLVWGLTEIHPFEDGNGRTASDFAQYTLMQRWGVRGPIFTDSRRLDKVLSPVFRAVVRRNDGTPEGFLRQLRDLIAVFSQVHLAALKAHDDFSTMAKVLAASLRDADSA